MGSEATGGYLSVSSALDLATSLSFLLLPPQSLPPQSLHPQSLPPLSLPHGAAFFFVCFGAFFLFFCNFVVLVCTACGNSEL
jgi:hypothetical protein